MINILSAIATYYNIKEAITDTVLFSMTGVMALIAEINSGTFSDGARSEGNTTIVIWTYLSIFTVIVGRFAMIVMKVWDKYLSIKERNLKIKREERELNHKIEMDRIEKIEQADIIRQIRDETFKNSNV